MVQSAFASTNIKRSQNRPHSMRLFETDNNTDFRSQQDILVMNRYSFSTSLTQTPPSPKSKSIVDQIRERHRLPNPWRVGEVAQLLVKGNPDLRGRGGQWCIITEAFEFSCLVQVWDGIIQVKIENLKDLPYSPSQRKELQQISDRLAKMPVQNMEESVKAFLAGLGRIQRPFLTPTEDKILSTLEDLYQ